MLHTQKRCAELILKSRRKSPPVPGELFVFERVQKDRLESKEVGDVRLIQLSNPCGKDSCSPDTSEARRHLLSIREDSESRS